MWKLSVARFPDGPSPLVSLNVEVNCYYSHGYRSRGNQLELWAVATKLPLHQAAIDLCRRLGRDVPWIRRW